MANVKWQYLVTSKVTYLVTDPLIWITLSEAWHCPFSGSAARAYSGRTAAKPPATWPLQCLRLLSALRSQASEKCLSNQTTAFPSGWNACFHSTWYTFKCISLAYDEWGCFLDFLHYCNIIFDHPVCSDFLGFAQIVNLLKGSAADEVTAEDLAEHPEVQPVVATLDISPKFEFPLRVRSVPTYFGPRRCLSLYRLQCPHHRRWFGKSFA